MPGQVREEPGRVCAECSVVLEVLREVKGPSFLGAFAISLKARIKIPTLRQAQGRLSRAKSAREMGHPLEAKIKSPSVSRKNRAIRTGHPMCFFVRRVITLAARVGRTGVRPYTSLRAYQGWFGFVDAVPGGGGFQFAVHVIDVRHAFGFEPFAEGRIIECRGAAIRIVGRANERAELVWHSRGVGGREARDAQPDVVAFDADVTPRARRPRRSRRSCARSGRADPACSGSASTTSRRTARSPRLSAVRGDRA